MQLNAVNSPRTRVGFQCVCVHACKGVPAQAHVHAAVRQGHGNKHAQRLAECGAAPVDVR